MLFVLLLGQVAIGDFLVWLWSLQCLKFSFLLIDRGFWASLLTIWIRIDCDDPSNYLTTRFVSRRMDCRFWVVEAARLLLLLVFSFLILTMTTNLRQQSIK